MNDDYQLMHLTYLCNLARY